MFAGMKYKYIWKYLSNYLPTFVFHCSKNVLITEKELCVVA